MGLGVRMSREWLERCLRRFQKGEYECSQLAKDIENFFSTPEPKQDEEPVAWTCQDELNALGTDVTCYMYAEPLVGETNIPLYLHPAPRKEFVRLSQEEIQTIYLTRYDTPNLFARAIEDALEEKNK